MRCEGSILYDLGDCKSINAMDIPETSVNNTFISAATVPISVGTEETLNSEETLCDGSGEHISRKKL